MKDMSKIVKLESGEKFLLFKIFKIQNEKFIAGVKIEDNKYINDFHIFIENNKNGEKYLEEITDPNIIKLIIDNFIINEFNN